VSDFLTYLKGLKPKTRWLQPSFLWVERESVKMITKELEEMKFKWSTGA